MIKTIFTILILVLSIQCNFSQSRKDIEKERELSKNNKVKTKICTIENGKEITSFDINGKTVKKESYEKNGVKSVEVKFIYDENDNLVREEYLYQSGEKSSTKYEYDGSGNKISAKSAGFYEIIIYDADNNISEILISGL